MGVGVGWRTSSPRTCRLAARASRFRASAAPTTASAACTPAASTGTGASASAPVSAAGAHPSRAWHTWLTMSSTAASARSVSREWSTCTQRRASSVDQGRGALPVIKRHLNTRGCVAGALSARGWKSTLQPPFDSLKTPIATSPRTHMPARQAPSGAPTGAVHSTLPHLFEAPEQICAVGRGAERDLPQGATSQGRQQPQASRLACRPRKQHRGAWGITSNGARLAMAATVCGGGGRERGTTGGLP